jgi:hypothetical protein
MALTTIAKIGDGAVLAIHSTAATQVHTVVTNFVTVAECLTFNANLECSEHDVTSMASAGIRQFIPGHLAATVNATINFLPLTEDAQLLDTYQAKKTCSWLLRIPQAHTTTTLSNYLFLGFITGLTFNVDRDAPNTADITIRVADSVMED